jgi:hypothetical protein
LSNSEYFNIVDFGRRGYGVSLYSETGTTQTVVKVPKYHLSVNGTKVFMSEDSEEVG